MADTDYLATIPSDAKEQATFLERHERREAVLTLRRRGMTYRQISETLKTMDPPIVVSTQAVAQMVKRALEHAHRVEAESVEELRALENERLDELLAAWGSKARAGDPKAAAIVLRVSERRAKMNGLDAPTRVEHDHRGSILHELGADPEEVARSREAFQTAFTDTGAADPVLEAEYEELPNGLPDA